MTGRPDADAREPEAGPRHGWAWAVIPADCRRAEVLGDGELAALLRAAGVRQVAEDTSLQAQPGPDAILLGPGRSAGSDIDAVADRLAPGGIVAVPVGGGGRSGVARWARRRVGAAARVAASSRRWERAMRAAGLEPRTLATGARWRAHHLQPGDGRALPTTGAIVIGTRGKPRPNVLERGLAEAEHALGTRLRIAETTVRGSGALLARAIADDGHEYLLRLAAGPSAALLESSLANLRAIAAGAPGMVRDRLVLPLAECDLELASLAVEPRVEGRAPSRLGRRLWSESLEFLVGLRSATPAGPAPAGLAADADQLAPHLSEPERGVLERTVRSLADLLAPLPTGWGHGDFWPGNLLARRGRLLAVVDWDGARADALPLLDLLHLIALGDTRLRRRSHGRRCTAALWPLARSGGDERIRAYCEATATPREPATLEALAVAYWLTRVARDLRTFGDRAGRRRWMEENVHHPLAELAGG